MDKTTAIMDAVKRREIMESMDKELDEFMNAMALSRQPTTSDEPFDFDKWSKKVDEHPLFMKELKPNENGEFSEAVQALQALKYDDDDVSTTPEDLNRKADFEASCGNKYFQLKKYRFAVDAYTDAIRLRCPDRIRNGILHYNRSASHYRIGNIRSAFKDAMLATKYNPLSFKAIRLCAECLINLKHYDQCVDWLENNLPPLYDCIEIPREELKKLEEMLEDVKKADVKCKLAEKMRSEEEKRRADEMIHLVREIHKRGINMTLMPYVNDDPESIQEWHDNLRQSVSNVDELPLVYYDKSSEELVWPLIAQYPAENRWDLIKDCAESTPIGELFAELLASPADWDHEHKYRTGNVNFYVEMASVGELWFTPPTYNLRQALALPGIEIMRGLGVINLFTKEYAAKELVEIAPNRYRFIAENKM